MVSFLMMGSLILGLIALILPIVNISRNKRNYNKNCAVYSIFSLSACAISISFQLIYSNYMVGIEDWSALIDTIGTSTLLSLILLIVTLILNVISIGIYSNNKK